MFENRTLTYHSRACFDVLTLFVILNPRLFKKDMENQSPKKKQRRSFSREYKLGVVDWYLENERNIAVTARRYGLARKQVRTWVNSEEKIQKQNLKAKQVEEVVRASIR